MAVTIRQLSNWKQQGRAIAMLTAWDYAIARLADAAGIDVILVGDSLAMVALGYANTLPITLDAMLHHAAAVRRGVERALVVCDLPFLSYQESPAQAIRAAGRALKETGVQAVKVEGGSRAIADTVARLSEIGIPVMGHVGLTPQSVHRLGFKQQGNTPEQADRIFAEAKALAEAGAFALIVEHVPSELAGQIAQTLSIPAIGIGAGSGCDGQVLVTADVLGLTDKLPPFAKAYAQLQPTISQAIRDYIADVREGRFPAR